MKAQQNRKFDMLRRVQQFLDEFAAALGSVNSSGARRNLDTLVMEMGTNEAMQASSRLASKGHTATLEVARKELVQHHMRPVATIAAAHLRDVPEFRAFKVDGRVKLVVLVQEAMAMAASAREHSQVFVNNGLAPSFADDLQAAASEVRALIDARGKSRADLAGASAGLAANGTQSHLVLRLLDAQVKKALSGDDKALAAWKSARRLGRGKVVPIEDTIPQPVVPSVSTAVPPQAKAA